MRIWEENEELRVLRTKVKHEYNTSKTVSVKCPSCRQSPVVVYDNEFGYRLSCTCGLLNVGEKY